MPPGDVLPVLTYPDVVAAAAWLCRAFGFRARLRIGEHRVQLVHRGGGLVVAQGPGASLAAEHHSVLVAVDDADAHCARALASGATLVMVPTTFPYGERQYSVQDPGGHRWTFSQSVADVDPAAWGGQLVE